MKRLVVALEAARATRSRIAKETALAEAFASIGADASSDADLALATAARVASGRALPVGDGRKLGVGGALVFEVAVEQCGGSADALVASARKHGDFGDAIGEELAKLPGAATREGIPLADLARAFDALASATGRAAKQEILRGLFARATPLEAKYLAKAIFASLRIGAQEGSIVAAIARAFGRDAETVRRAAALVADPGAVAVLAKHDRLGDARFEIGRPIAYMLATPLETIASPLDPSRLVVEDKIDGVRAQVHIRAGEVAIFARGLERVTGAFPEVVEAMREMQADVALDGELVALGEAGRPRPFQALQTRLNRAIPTDAQIAAAPVTFVAYDLLADESGTAIELPWTERRARLEAFARAHGPRRAFALHPYVRMETSEATLPAAIDDAFTAARARGHEGVVLKRVDAPYEAGRRGSAWIKVKRAFATLDVVVTAVEQGHGKRAGVLSDYTFAVWKGDELVDVGKAYSGLTDAEIEALTRRFESITVERRGGWRRVVPEVVIEVAFDGIQRSRRHASGFALRFPRIARIRDDKKPSEADALEGVEALFASQVETGHREEAPAEGETPRARSRTSKAKNAKQLSLFLEADPPKRPKPTSG